MPPIEASAEQVGNWVRKPERDPALRGWGWGEAGPAPGANGADHELRGLDHINERIVDRSNAWSTSRSRLAGGMGTSVKAGPARPRHGGGVTRD